MLLQFFLSKFPKVMKTCSVSFSCHNMKSKKSILKVCSDEDASELAANLLASGEVIAVPTDTVYGLASSANNRDAIQKLYQIKGRDAHKPVAICVSHIGDVRKWGHAEHLPDTLLTKLLPGPVTIVLEKTIDLNNPFLNSNTTKIGIRIPDYNFINEVTKKLDMPMALTSANFSSESSTLCVEEFQELYPYLGAVFDGGVLSKGLDKNRAGSTVIDLSEPGVYCIIRNGISCNHVIDLLKEHNIKSCVR